MSEWQTMDRPGYLGRHRDDKYQEWSDQYGQDNWRLVWRIGSNYFEIEAALALYEDAYYHFFDEHPEVADQLVAEANDVYDDSPTNVECGLRYFPQETKRTHLQDVAIRRVLVRLGQWFQGNQLIQIRDRLGEHPLSLTLSPGQVPFHRLNLIVRPELTGWWQPGSVESFYQSNRYLQTKASG